MRGLERTNGERKRRERERKGGSPCYKYGGSGIIRKPPVTNWSNFAPRTAIVYRSRAHEEGLTRVKPLKRPFFAPTRIVIIVERSGWLASFESRHLDDDDNDDDDESDATMESRFSRCPGQFYIQRPSGGMSFSGAPERRTEKDGTSGEKKRGEGTRVYAKDLYE